VINGKLPLDFDLESTAIAETQTAADRQNKRHGPAVTPAEIADCLGLPSRAPPVALAAPEHAAQPEWF
jgi:hypothetical protein